MTLHNLGYIAYHRNDQQQAAALFKESLVLFDRLEDQEGIAWCLEGFAAVAIAGGHFVRATRHLGAAEALRDAIGASIWPADQVEHDRAVAIVHTKLERHLIERAWAAGREMTVEQAARYALEAPATEEL